jgi:peptidoglycan/LPS O-acetylase OafA/YrhL
LWHKERSADAKTTVPVSEPVKPRSAHSPTADHLIHLDVLRGLAILMVFFVHLHGATFGWNHLPLAGYFPDFSVAATFSSRVFYPYCLGGLGVTLFFVLSGYCIHGSLLAFEAKTKGAAASGEFLRYFFIRRFFRIFPVYLLAVVYFGFFHAPTALTHENLWPQLLSHLFMVHNADPDTFGGINGAFWSLAYEWQLYCFYPVFVWLRRRFGLFRAFSFVVIGSLLYSQFAAEIGADLYPLKSAVFRSKYMLVWFLGVLLCERHARGERVFPRSRVGFGLLATFGVFASQFGPLQPILWEIWAFVFGWLLELYRDRREPSRLEHGLAWVGVVSYSLYLWHGPLIETLLPLLKPALRSGFPYNQMTVGSLLVLAPLLLLSWITYSLVEQPFHKLGIRLSKTWSRPAVSRASQTPTSTRPPAPVA